MDSMEVNTPCEVVFKIIENNIKLRTPFLATRYGDGEAILLENNNENYVNHIFKRQIGKNLDSNSIKNIRENLIETLNNSDLIGLPTNSHLKRKDVYWSKSIGILNENCSIDIKQFGSIDFHYEFLKNWENSSSYYDLLLNNIPELYIISCRNIVDGFLRRFNIGKVELMATPPEIMFENETYLGTPHYPGRFFEIKDSIESLGKLNGKLLLYGAGFIGIIYGLFWKNNGGVAVDIGSVFDKFAGKDTRGKGCGPTSIDLKYKL